MQINRTGLRTFFLSTALLSLFSATTLNAQTAQKAQTKPFLIQNKLPHLTMIIKKHWDDKNLALTPTQKQKLLQIRKETLHGVQSLAKQIQPLEASIVQASLSGTHPDDLKEDVKKLANLKAKATMIHLQCIYNTKAVLTKKQLKALQ